MIFLGLSIDEFLDLLPVDIAEMSRQKVIRDEGQMRFHAEIARSQAILIYSGFPRDKPKQINAKRLWPLPWDSEVQERNKPLPNVNWEKVNKVFDDQINARKSNNSEPFSLN